MCFEKTFPYHWKHIPPGKGGERTWVGLSRADFLADLEHWNTLGAGAWIYGECPKIVA